MVGVCCAWNKQHIRTMFQQARSLIVVSQTDRLVPRDLSEELRDGLHDPEWEVMPTIRGHMGGALPSPGSSEEYFLATQIRVFLKTLAP
jgi:hypothetical protein